jgi:hypothetical protein
MWDGSETCLSLTPSKAFCARDGSAKETKLVLVFSRYESYEDKIREVQAQGAIGIHHDGERIREDTLAGRCGS